MTKIQDILNELEKVAPASLKEEYDNIGLMLGNPDEEVKKIVACLDVTSAVVDLAIKKGANLIISHHPLIFCPLYEIDTSDGKGKIIEKCIKNDIAVISEHTNLDKAEKGMNYTLAQILGGKNIKVQTEHCGVLFEVEKMDIKDFAKLVSMKLNDETVTYTNTKKKVKKVFACTGGGGSDKENYEFAKKEADVYLSGDFKHHNYIDAKEDNYAVVSFSHYSSEIIAENIIKGLIESALGVTVLTSKQERPFNTII